MSPQTRTWTRLREPRPAGANSSEKLWTKRGLSGKRILLRASVACERHPPTSVRHSAGISSKRNQAWERRGTRPGEIAASRPPALPGSSAGRGLSNLRLQEHDRPPEQVLSRSGRRCRRAATEQRSGGVRLFGRPRRAGEPTHSPRPLGVERSPLVNPPSFHLSRFAPRVSPRHDTELKLFHFWRPSPSRRPRTPSTSAVPVRDTQTRPPPRQEPSSHRAGRRARPGSPGRPKPILGKERVSPDLIEFSAHGLQDSFPGRQQ